MPTESLQTFFDFFSACSDLQSPAHRCLPQGPKVDAMDAHSAKSRDAFAPQASLSHFPAHYAQSIASALNAKTEELTTLTIRNGTRSVYHAILQYAALYLSSPAPRHTHPTTPRNLCISQNFPFESHDTLDDDDHDDTADLTSMAYALSMGDMRLSRRAMRRMRQASDIQPGRGIREQKCHSLVPRLLLNLGDCVVLWPPPSHLMPSAVRSRRRELYEVAKKATHYCSPPKKWTVDADGVVQELEEPNTPTAPPIHHAPDNPISNHANHNDIADDINQKQHSEHSFDVFIAHYEIGLPVQDQRGSTTTERKLLIATTNGVSALTNFLSGVAAWSFEKDRLYKFKHCCYELYRFRSDSIGSSGWESQGHRRARPIDSVVLADGQMDNILQDVTNFLQPSTKKWFTSHGLSHRRSYLFYGKPGTGKTSTIRAIAGEFGLNCCFLSMTDAGFSNQKLFDALRQIPSNALLVLEDVDSLFNMDRSSKSTPSLTFSGMLNALDGIASSDGVITVMTTNHMERLESALIRGGRVDRRFYFDWPSERQLQKLFLTYYKDAPKEVAAKFARAVFERREGVEARSIATLQQLFVYFREHSAEHCVSHMDDFFEMHFPTPPDAHGDSLYL
eukprot:TRINITY_DN3338_c0_g1_i1.p1 TRINITY_DN3338_c0_g1~~TRINITY_DN3338_c0_g1_i1.p1  ORF type:complete len:707 (-),score=89.67 TRINITY_DN3338_c0_g1_i1:1762-3621(-)